MFPMGMTPAIPLTMDPDFVHEKDSMKVHMLEEPQPFWLGMFCVVQDRDGNTGVGRIMGMDHETRTYLILWAIAPEEHGHYLKRPPQGRG